MQTKKRVIVIGGGIGGTMTANNLVNKLYPEICRDEIEVMMISNSEIHEYKPANMYVAFNSFYPHELRRKQRSLLRPEINFQVEEVVEFNFQGCYVACKNKQKYYYDYLLISTGCIPSPERIEGLKQAGDHFYQTEPAKQLGTKLRNIKEGRILITVNFPETPNVPHQCGIAPVETTLMLHEYLTKLGVRDKVEIMYTYPTVAQTVKNCLFLQKPTCSVLPTIFESMGINYARNFTLDKVDPEGKVAYSKEGQSENFDILMATPPIRAVDAVLNSGVSKAFNNEGWLPTDKYTLKLQGVPHVDNVYVMGDTVDLPISKAGGSCHNQSPVITENIASEIRRGYTSAVYDGKVHAVAQMGLNSGMPLWYDYEQDVTPVPATKLGSLFRKSFNRGIYWALARGLV